MSARRPTTIKRGFTLLEVMIAIAIVALAMGAIVEIESHAIAKTNDSKHIIVATLLARGKILDVQQKLDEDGWGDFMKTLDGDFEEEGFADFRWVARVRKVEVPTPSTMGGRADSPPGEAGGGMAMAAMLPMVQNLGTVLENAVREIELRVLWKDGRYEQSIRVVTHVVSRDSLARSIQNMGLAGLPAGGLGAGGLPGGAPGRVTPGTAGGRGGAARGIRAPIGNRVGGGLPASIGGTK